MGIWVKYLQLISTEDITFLLLGNLSSLHSGPSIMAKFCSWAQVSKTYSKTIRFVTWWEQPVFVQFTVSSEVTSSYS